MIDKDKQFDGMGNDEKALLLSRYADAVILDEYRQSHANDGIYVPFEQLGYTIELEEGEMADLFIANLMDPPDRISVLAATDTPTLEVPEGRRTLIITIYSKEVQTDYFLNFKPMEIKPIEFLKTVNRVYGEAEFNRWGELVSGSEMRELVSNRGAIDDSEVELLYEVLSFIKSRN